MQMNKDESFISVVATIFNNESILRDFVLDVVRELKKHYRYYELILIDDGSTDRSMEIIDSLILQMEGIRCLRLSRRYGKEIAIYAGLENTIGDYVVVLSPESDPVTLLSSFVQKAANSGGIVYGISMKKENQSRLYRICRGLFFSIFVRLFRLDIPKHATYYLAFSRSALNALIRIKDKVRFVRHLSMTIGFPKESIHYKSEYRNEEKTQRLQFQSFEDAIAMITRHSTLPLRAVAWIGIAGSIMNVIYVGYIILIYFIKDHVAEGWVTTSMLNASMYLLLFLVLTVFSRYFIVILDEMRNRPEYFIAEEKSSSILLTHPERLNVV